MNAASSLLVALALLPLGCAMDTPPTACTTSSVVTLSPMAATADHTAAAPANQQQFTATSAQQATGAGCAVSTAIAVLKPTWSVSDSIHVQVSSAQDATNGVATCLGATTGAVTLTAASSANTQTLLGSVTLTCK